MVLHSGASESGPILGVCKLTALHSTDTIGLGNPVIEVGPDRVVWEDLKRRSKWTHKTYTLEYGEREDRKKDG